MERYYQDLCYSTHGIDQLFSAVYVITSPFSACLLVSKPIP
jgi:hypothetical protein